MNDYKLKFENYKNAVNRLKEGVMKFNEDNDLLRDGLIKRFEFTFELAWKAMKAIYEDEGLHNLNSPKTVLKEAFLSGFIEDESLWLMMLNDRNSTAHIYSEKIAVEICKNILSKYVYALEALMYKIQISKLKT
jgi:nucleotidyltransferase substrate binding protein (TIGR01987 family)